MTPLRTRHQTLSSCTVRRPAGDPSLRLMMHGRIRPMEEDMGFWEKLFARR